MTPNDQALREKVEAARKWYESLSPVDRALHDDDQRRSWVRGESGTDPGEHVLAAEVRRLRALLPIARSPISEAEVSVWPAGGFPPAPHAVPFSPEPAPVAQRSEPIPAELRELIDELREFEVRPVGSIGEWRTPSLTNRAADAIERLMEPPSPPNAATDYANLSEAEKNSDRKEADAILALFAHAPVTEEMVKRAAREIYASLHHLMRVSGTEAQTAYERAARAILTLPAPVAQRSEITPMTDEQIKHMVSRFLCWRLPENFAPDCGIQFDADGAKKLNPRNARYEPVGTNLFDYNQAEAMVRHMLEDMPSPPNAEEAAALERQTILPPEAWELLNLAESMGSNPFHRYGELLDAARAYASTRGGERE